MPEILSPESARARERILGTKDATMKELLQLSSSDDEDSETYSRSITENDFEDESDLPIDDADNREVSLDSAAATIQELTNQLEGFEIAQVRDELNDYISQLQAKEVEGSPLVSFPENFSDILETVEADGVSTTQDLLITQLESTPSQSIFWRTQPDIQPDVLPNEESDDLGVPEEIAKGLKDIRNLDAARRLKRKMSAKKSPKVARKEEPSEPTHENEPFKSSHPLTTNEESRLGSLLQRVESTQTEDEEVNFPSAYTFDEEDLCKLVEIEEKLKKLSPVRKEVVHSLNKIQTRGKSPKKQKSFKENLIEFEQDKIEEREKLNAIDEKLAALSSEIQFTENEIRAVLALSQGKLPEQIESPEALPQLTDTLPAILLHRGEKRASTARTSLKSTLPKLPFHRPSSTP